MTDWIAPVPRSSPGQAPGRPRPVVVEKCKWDGTIAARERAEAAVIPHGLVWHVRKGTVRHKLRKDRRKRVGGDQVWVALPAQWVVLCCFLKRDAIQRFKLHAAIAPARVERQLVRWTDLDLDLLIGPEGLEVVDESQFAERAGQLGYTPDVVAGAWQGVSGLAPAYLQGAWPFDGWLEDTIDSVFSTTPRGLGRRAGPEGHALVEEETRPG